VDGQEFEVVGDVPTPCEDDVMDVEGKIPLGGGGDVQFDVMGD
jgi:hypothetical protein